MALLLDADDGDRGVVIVDTGFTGGIAAQHDALEAVAPRRGIVTSEPGSLDHVAVGRRGVLLILCGKNPAAEIALQLFESL